MLRGEFPDDFIDEVEAPDPDLERDYPGYE